MFLQKETVFGLFELQFFPDIYWSQWGIGFRIEGGRTHRKIYKKGIFLDFVFQIGPLFATLGMARFPTKRSE